MYSSFGIRKIVSTARFELSIHQRHLEFEFEIRDGAQPADDGGGFPRDREIHEQSVQRRDLDFLAPPDGAAEQVEPLLEV